MSGAHHHGHTHGHSHGHDHGHGHGHGHAHGARHGTAFAIAVTLNMAFVVAEVAAGLLGGSMALIADAGHNLSDVLSLLLAWGASVLAARPPSTRFTYGFKSSSILAAIANAALLWVALGAILVETIRRLGDPVPADGMTMIVVATIGIVINGASALLFVKGSKGDLNLRAAFLHLIADAAVSAGVVVAGIGVLLWGAGWIDPVTSLVITFVIAWSSWGLLRDSVKMGLLGVPEGIDGGAVRAFADAELGVERDCRVIAVVGLDVDHPGADRPRLGLQRFDQRGRDPFAPAVSRHGEVVDIDLLARLLELAEHVGGHGADDALSVRGDLEDEVGAAERLVQPRIVEPVRAVARQIIEDLAEQVECLARKEKVARREADDLPVLRHG